MPPFVTHEDLDLKSARVMRAVSLVVSTQAPLGN